MIQFWLDNFMELFNLQNINFTKDKPDSKSENYIKILNLIAIASIVSGMSMVFLTKNVVYFGMIIVVMSFTILVKSHIKINSFTSVQNKLSNNFQTGSFLVLPATKNDNKLYVNNAFNFNKGDVISLTSNGQTLETNIIADVKFTTTANTPVVILLNELKGNYPRNTTFIAKVSNASPSIIPPPDPNESIKAAGSGASNSHTEVLKNYPYNDVNQNRYDWNLELASMGGNKPNDVANYEYQGQPFGPLKCRNSSVNNAMGTINVTEYDDTPTVFGTCNVNEQDPNGRSVDWNMTNNQEATISQSRNDLLFHKGNSQMVYSPMPVDTIPNNQEAFAHFCYRSPTNLVNPKYASIFVNDPEKFKLVAKLARATGTENGGGGGR